MYRAPTGHFKQLLHKFGSHGHPIPFALHNMVTEQIKATHENGIIKEAVSTH